MTLGCKDKRDCLAYGCQDAKVCGPNRASGHLQNSMASEKMEPKASAPEDVIQAGGAEGALAEALSFKLTHHVDDAKALIRGDAPNGAVAIGQANAEGATTSTPRVSVLLTGSEKGLEVNGKLHTWDSLQDVGKVSAGDLVILHYLSSYLLKVAASVEGV